ncbi:NAD-P-binding protein [Peniophora sp. CONT]|nr:NAD-P-binding protein [Peniophora sp. CONT]
MLESLFGISYNPSRDVPNQTGKVFFITGAYSGIGYATTKELARHGAKVYLACRTEDRALAAITKLEEEVPDIKGKDRLHFIQVDMSNMRSVKRAAEEFIQKERRLDVLLHNAGRLTSAYEMSEEGVELTMAVNYLSVFVLTQSLLPLLKATAAEPDADVRVAVVSSMAHRFGPARLKLDSLEAWNDYAGNRSESYKAKCDRYGASKRMEIMWAFYLQKLLDEENVPITVISLHPGVIGTDGLQHNSPFWAYWFMKYFGVTEEQGAFTSLFATTSSTLKSQRNKYKGKYLEPFGKITTPAAVDAHDEKSSKLLYDTSVKVAEQVLSRSAGTS